MEKERDEREDGFVEEIEMIRAAVANLEAANLEKEKLWEERGRKMLQLYEHREASKEDVRVIEELEVEVLKRELMLEKERNELKYTKM